MTDYIHFSENNLDVYSIKLANFILRANVESESLLKELFKRTEHYKGLTQKEKNLELENNTYTEDKKDDNNNYYELNNQSNDNYEEPIYTNPEPQVTERHIWDELGISEYDYYNSPMSSWQTVDFSISDYGSLFAAENACRNYGLSYEPYVNGEESFNCDIVTSYSGNYLGYMFYTRKIN